MKANKIQDERVEELNNKVIEFENKLDKIRVNAKRVSDFFSTAVLDLRSQIRSFCEELIKLNPILYGSNAEETLWRRVFHDPIQNSKKLKKHAYTEEDAVILLCHINAGIGYFNDFIVKLQLDYQLNLHGVVDSPVYRSHKVSNSDKQLCNWAELAVYRSLVCLGDLNRYKSEVSQNFDVNVAIRCYVQAFSYKPDYGKPHNQIAMICKYSQNWLNACYHYLRSVTCEYPFEGSIINLQRLMEKMKKHNGNHNNHINSEQFIVNFLEIIDILYFEKKNQVIVKNKCQENLDIFKTLLQTSSSDINNLASSSDCITNNALFKIIVICLITLEKLQTNKSVNVSFLKSFVLSIFTQLIEYVINQFEEEVNAFDISSSKQSSDGKRRKKKLVRCRRKLEDSHSLPNSDDSEGEHTSSMGLISNSEEDTETDSTDYSTSGSDASTNDDKRTNVSSTDSVKKTQIMKPVDLLQIVTRLEFIQCIKILTDWLMGHIPILKEINNIDKNCLSKIVNLLNLLISLNINDTFLKNFNNKVSNILKIVENNYAQIPLSEDILLKKLNAFLYVQNKINWNKLTNLQLEPQDEMVFRIQKLLSFGYFLTKIREIRVTFNKERNTFEVCDKTKSRLNEKTVAKSEVKTTSNPSVMQSMGVLWLESEIQNLEIKLRKNVVLSPYLVVDTEVLVYYPFEVKQFIATENFIISIPTVVMRQMDDMKHESGRTRQAIRWLEAEMKSGSGRNFVKIQDDRERTCIPFVKYPIKQTKETKVFFQIMEYAYYLAQKHSALDLTLVTVLTGNKQLNFGRKCQQNNNASANDLIFKGLAEAANLQFEPVTVFFQKWRDLNHPKKFFNNSRFKTNKQR